MPATTPRFGFRYPCEQDPISVTDFQNLAYDIEAVASTVNALATLAPHRPAASVAVSPSSSTSQAFTVNTPTNWLFNREWFDTDNMVDLAANNDRITIRTAGFYMADVSMGLGLTPNTTLTSQKMDITVNSTVMLSRKFGRMAFTGSVGGLLPQRLNVGDVVRFRYTWTGTGGPAVTPVTFADIRMDVRMVCP